jgi:YesN/AraC family two-component response regulator
MDKKRERVMFGTKQDAKTRVLIVDDEELIRKTLRRVLDRAGGFEIVGEAADGVEGLMKANELQPDVVLLDVAMPEMDGLTAFPKIRQAAPDSKIVVLTGFFGMGKEFSDLGADGFLPKSVRTKEMANLLNRLTATNLVDKDGPHI